MAKKDNKQDKRENLQQTANGTGQEETKKRTFASPKTGYDAEPDLPSMERLANGYNNGYPPKTIMTKEEIIENGTILQKIRLLISNIDLSGYFETTEQLTKEERVKILSSFQTKEDRQLSNLCVKEYNRISEFAKHLTYFFKRFQTSYAILAVLLNKWDSYEYTAKQLSNMYQTLKEAFVTFWDEEEHEVKLIDIYPEDTLRNLIQDILYSNILDGATLKFDEKTENFYIDVDEKGGLYSQILEEAKSTTKDLSDFKAYVMVAKDYIIKSKLQYMPTSIWMSIESAEEETYTRYLVKNLRYFRSELNMRKAAGETITPEEEKRAVIPDFFEVQPSKNVLKDCKLAIKKM